MLINPKFTRRRMNIEAWGARANTAGLDVFGALIQTRDIVKEQGDDAVRVPAGIYYNTNGGEFDLDRDGMQLLCEDGIATFVHSTWGRYGVAVKANDCIVRGIRHVYPGTKGKITGGRSVRFHGEQPMQRCSAFINMGSRNRFENISDSGFVCGYRMLGGDLRYYAQSEFVSPMTTQTFKLNAAQEGQPDGYYIGAYIQVFGQANSMVRAYEITSYDAATNVVGWDETDVVVPTSTLWYLLLKEPSDENVLVNHRTDRVDFGITSLFQKRVSLEGDLIQTRVSGVGSQEAPPHGIYMRGNTDDELPINRPTAEEVHITANLHCYDSPEMVAYKIFDFRKLFISGSIRTPGGFGALYLRNGVYAKIGLAHNEGANTANDRNPPFSVQWEDVEEVDLDDAYMEMSPDFSQAGVGAHPNVVTMQGFGFHTLKRARVRRVRAKLAGTFTTDAYGVLVFGPENGAPNLGSLQVDSVDIESANSRPVQLLRAFATDDIVLGPDLRFTGQGGAKVTIEAGCGDVVVDYDSRNTGGRITVIDEATAAANTIAVTSGTYDSATGLVSLVLAKETFFAAGREPILSGLTGTGAYASLGGTWPVVASTGTSLVLAATAGLGAAAITGGTLTRISSVKVRDRATEGNRNLLLNPKFDDWAGYSAAVALVNGVVTTAADNWKAWRAGSSNATVSWQDGFRGALKCLRLQRNSGNTAPHSIFGVQELPTALVRLLEGKEVTLIFDGRAGADFSGGLLRTALYTGTATGAEDITSTGYPTGGAVSANQSVVIGTEGREYNARHLIPRGATRAAIRFEHHPTGTAGAADYVDITKVGLIAGATARAFASFL